MFLLVFLLIVYINVFFNLIKRQLVSCYKLLQTKEAWDRLVNTIKRLKLLESLCPGKARSIKEVVEILNLTKINP
jgi:hypothetical protein